jgi:hypothetical protein
MDKQKAFLLPPYMVANEQVKAYHASIQLFTAKLVVDKKGH